MGGVPFLLVFASIQKHFSQAKNAHNNLLYFLFEKNASGNINVST
jgi:hypothetical protein